MASRKGERPSRPGAVASAPCARVFPSRPQASASWAWRRGEGQALERLLALAASLGVDQHGLDAYQPMPGCQAYTAFVAWLALNGSRGELAVAFLANLAAWGENCRRLAELLRGRSETSFLEFFAEPAPGFEQQALAVADQGLAADDSPERARRAARLLQAYELMFWDTLADAL